MDHICPQLAILKFGTVGLALSEARQYILMVKAVIIHCSFTVARERDPRAINRDTSDGFREFGVELPIGRSTHSIQNIGSLEFGPWEGLGQAGQYTPRRLAQPPGTTVFLYSMWATVELTYQQGMKGNSPAEAVLDTA